MQLAGCSALRIDRARSRHHRPMLTLRAATSNTGVLHVYEVTPGALVSTIRVAAVDSSQVLQDHQNRRQKAKVARGTGDPSGRGHRCRQLAMVDLCLWPNDVNWKLFKMCVESAIA